MRKIIARGLLYDVLIEPLLKKIKERVARCVSQYGLSPVLDMCCGTGKQCHFIGNNGQTAFGLDIDSKMLEYAASKYPHIVFICADAAHIPLKRRSLNGVIISYALHDKPPEMRTQMLNEAKSLLIPDGKIILLDFENPWNRLSRLGSLFTWVIERLAGGEHYANRKKFLKQGGLEEFIKQNNLVKVEKHPVPLGNSSLTIVKFKDDSKCEEAKEKDMRSH